MFPVKALPQAITVLLLTALTLSVHAQDNLDNADDAVTPYRPSVSSPAQLPQAGQLEFELGGISSKTGDEQRTSLPYSFKLAFSPQWGVLLEGEAFVSEHGNDGPRNSGVGDTTVVLKRAFLFSEATAAGIELGAKIPTSKHSIGSGKADYSLNGIFSQDISVVHMDANANLTRLGAPDDGSGRVQQGLSTSFSMPVAEKWGATAEVSGTRLRGAASTAQVLLATTYNPTKRLAIDVGFTRGLNQASPHWGLFSGLVVPLAKLW